MGGWRPSPGTVALQVTPDQTGGAMPMSLRRFPSKAVEKLGHYVYLYIDPETEEVFYVGKGRANRAFSHLKDTRETAKSKRIERIRKRGQEPRVEILKYGLTEKEALLVEATAIDLLDVRKLTNAVRGHGSRRAARGSADEIASQLCADRVDVAEEAIPNRWEFVGKVAEDRIRRKYVGKSVAHYWPKGAQNPVQYVNC
jgi:hypothetical protein